MIYKIFLLLTFLFVFNGVCVAQDSLDIETEEPKISLNKYQLNQIYRRILVKKLAKNDTAKIKELFLFLLQQGRQDSTVNIGIDENMALIYITKQIESISLKDLDKYGNDINPDFVRCGIVINEFNTAINEYLIKNKIYLETAIRQTNLTEEEKDFHFLHLQYVTHYSNQRYRYYKHPDDLNKIANNFLQKYPTSIYTSYIKKYIRQEYIPSEWGNAVYVGGAYNLFTSNLGQKFNNFVDIRIHYELHYKKIFINTGFDIAFNSSVRENINYRNGGVWQKDASAIIMIFPIRLGFWLLDTKKLRIYPFVGGAGMGIVPKGKDEKAIPNSRALEISAWAYTAGIQTDIKIKEVKETYHQNYDAIRITLGYTQPNFWGYATNFDGQIIYFSLGYGGFWKNMKRRK